MNVLVAAILYWMLVDAGQQLALCQTSDDMTRLQWDLLHNYNTTIRPVRNLSDITIVTLDIHFLQIEYLDMKTQTLKCNGWFDIIWQDHFLTWNPRNYGGIDHILISQNRIWIPDIVPLNIVNGLRKFASVDFLVNILSNGSVFWLPDFNLKTACPVDIRYFPFDTQLCEIQVTSWMHSSKMLRLRFNDKIPDFRYNLDNGEFHIEASNTKVTHDYEEDTVRFYLKLDRRFSYYLMALILPVCLMSVMCVISFLVPVQSGEKMTMSMTTLLSFTVYLGVIDSAMPKTSEHMSFLLMYISGLLTVSLLSVVGNTVVLYFHYRCGKDNIADDMTKYGIENEPRGPRKENKHNMRLGNNHSDNDNIPLPSRCNCFRSFNIKVPDPQFANSANKVFFWIILSICVSLILLFFIMVNI